MAENMWINVIRYNNNGTSDEVSLLLLDDHYLVGP